MSLLNPKKILESGILIPPRDVDLNKIIQPNGIDLYVGNLLHVEADHSDSAGETYENVLEIGDNKVTKHLPEYTVPLEKMGGHPFFELKKNEIYKVMTDYSLKLPENVSAHIVVRSSLNRNGAFTMSGWWDSGYAGKIGFTLHPRSNIRLFLPCRIAQIIFYNSESSFLYNGSYGAGKKES